MRFPPRAARLLKEGVRGLLSDVQRPRKILGGPLRGESLYTSWHDYPGALLGRTERPLLRWLASHVRLGETWLDVGAHYGYVSMALSRLVGPTGRVYAFEPVASTVRCIEVTKSLGKLWNLTVIPVALSEDDGIRSIEIGLVRGMADSLLSVDDERVTIQVSSLDWLWESMGLKDDQIRGVKIDVQGMEIAAIRGMRSVIRAHRPILVVELHGGVDRDVFLSELASLRYDVIPEPVHIQNSAELFDDRSYAFYPLEESCVSSTR